MPITDVTMTFATPQGETSIVKGASVAEDDPKSPTKAGARNIDDGKSHRSFISRRSGRIGRHAQQLIHELNERIDFIADDCANLQ